MKKLFTLFSIFFCILAQAQNTACSAVFTIDNDEFYQNHVILYYSSDLVPAPNLAITWGDGNAFSGTIDELLSLDGHTYADSGLYTVCLNVVNGSCDTSFCRDIWVGNAPPAIINPACSTNFEYTYNMFSGPFYTQFMAAAPADSTLQLAWFINNIPITYYTGSISMPAENGFYYTFDIPDSAGYNADVTLLSYSQGCYSTVTKNITIDFDVLRSLNFQVQDSLSDYITQTGYPPYYDGTPYYYFGTKYPVKTQVYRYDLEITDSTLDLTNQTTTVGGQSRFENIPNGRYFGRAIYFEDSPEYGRYVPSYYGYSQLTNTFSTPHWYEAIQTFIDNNDTIAPQFAGAWQIVLISVNSPGGDGQIGGGTDWQDTLLRSNDAVEGVTVWAQDIITGNIVGYDITDENGTFAISNLPYGTYYIDVDYPGYYSTHDTVTLDAGNPTVSDVQIQILETTPVGIKENPVSITGLYPNPTNSTVFISLITKQNTDLQLTVYNLLGQPVLNQNNMVSSGNQTIVLPTENLAQGIYILQIADKKTGSVVTKKIVKD